MFKNSTVSSISLLIVFSCLLFFTIQSTKATSSQCRGPADTSSSGKRGAAATLKAEIDEMIETELLNAHVTLSEQGLNEEDLEYFTQLTEEHVRNTLFRRFFRRIGRAVRRIGRAIGRAFRAIGGLFRRRARQIIMNSVANFNGYTGPNREALESRRPFIGGGAANSNGNGKQAISAASALLFRRRRRRSSSRSRIAPIISKIGAKIKNVVNRVKGSMKSKMVALEKRNAQGASNHPVNCVACRVDCLKAYSTLGGSMFTSCGQRYYYYGCQAVQQCLQTRTASDDEIEGMVGICAFRNGCGFKNEWKGVSDNQLLADKLVGRIRASGQNPE